MEKFILSSAPIEISEFPNHKEATFLISVLDEYNSNNVLIEKAEGEKYHNTIIGYPILAYLKYDAKGKPSDFGGHELRSKYNSETKEIDYYFATHPIGSVTESWIEEREVEGYKGKKNVILIKTKLWKSRFPEYFKVFDKLWESGNISSSWEISSSKTKKTTKGKILKAFEFIGNCLLGSNVTGAVKGAGVLEVASNDELNYDLSSAFLEDINNSSLNTSSEDTDVFEDETKINESTLEGGSEDMPNENEKEMSALTDSDLYTRVRKAINSSDENKYFYLSMLYPYEFKAIAYVWDRESQEDFVQFNYTVSSDDTVSVVSQEDVKLRFVPVADIEAQVAELQTKVEESEKEIAEAGKQLVELSKEKEALEVQVSELTPFKEKVEELEKAEMERQLAEKVEEFKAYTLEDELITSEELETDDIIATIISELTLENFEQSKEKVDVVKGKKAIAIMREKKKCATEEVSETEVSEAKEEEVVVSAKTDLNDGSEDGVLSASDIVMMMLGKK